MSHPWLRRVLPWTLGVAALLSGIWLKVRVEAGLSLAQATQLDDAGEVELAILCYRRTVRWYSPGSGPVETAVARLLAIGDAMERRAGTSGKPADRDLALLAFRGLRGALRGTQSLYQPYEEHFPELEQRIARLTAEVETERTTPGEDADFAAREARHRELLGTTNAPHPGWSLLAVLGFLGWVSALLAFAARGFDPESNRVRRDVALRLGLAFVGSLSGWVLGLALA